MTVRFLGQRHESDLFGFGEGALGAGATVAGQCKEHTAIGQNDSTAKLGAYRVVA